MERPIVLVTGCSSGLGFALVKSLVKMNKYRVAITTRASSFEVIKIHFSDSENVMLEILDVTNHEETSRVVNKIALKWGRIDILVNNAGICFRGVVEHMDTRSEMLQMETNYLGPINLIREVLPIMREQGAGHILNISSVSGLVSMPTMGSYSASKHALEGITEALWYEAKPYGIKVTLVEPGFINSESFKKVLLSNKANLSVQLDGPHSEYYKSMVPFIEKLMKITFSTPDKIALQIEKLFLSKSAPLRKRVTLDAKLFWLLRKFLPESWFHEIMFWLLPGSVKWGGYTVIRNNSSN